MTPRILRAYAKAEEYKNHRVDEEAWHNNMYTLKAIMVALDKGFNGKKSTLEYPERPFTQNEEVNTNPNDVTIVDEEHPENTVLSKADQKKVDYLFASLNVMKTNFELEKLKKSQTDIADSVS